MSDKLIIKYIKYVIFACICLLPTVSRAEQWRLHPTYDGNIERVVDTPEFTYFQSHNQPFVEETTAHSSISCSLWRFDKENEEMEWLNKDNILSESIVHTIAYNPDKNYVVVAYDTGNIDLINDKGNIFNVPGLKLSGSEFSKEVNGISFSPETNEIFVATNFGFFVIDDKIGEIKYTKVFNKELNGVVRLGDKVLISLPEGVYYGSVKTDKFEEFKLLPGFEPSRRLMRLDKDKALVWCGDGWDGKVYAIVEKGVSFENVFISNTLLKGIEYSKSGAMICGYFDIYNVDRNLDITNISIQEPDRNSMAGSWNGSNYWFNKGRQGLVMKTYGKDGSWTTKINGLLPNASSAFKSDNMVYHPDYGMLVRNHGTNAVFTSQWVPATDVVSSLRNYVWTPRSAAYKSPDDAFIQWNPNGIVIDPNNTDHVYSGSFTHGLMRLNLADPSKSLRMGRYGDEANGRPGYIGVCEDMSYQLSCTFSTPAFDDYGNLWVARYDYDKGESGKDAFELWYWTPQDRAASKDSNSFKPLKKVDISGIKGSAFEQIVPLKMKGCENILMCITGEWNGGLVLIDHKGTLDVAGDDVITNIPKLKDNSGAEIDINFLLTAYQDKSTGLVWIGHEGGVFNFKPTDLLNNGGMVNLVKVARNDGTNLADYLLNGISVTSITTDNAGHKWFGTRGGGVVVTSSDGTEIVKTYTTGNSSLPDDIVYGICYNPDNNSMMISTDKGLAELYLSAASSESGKNNVKSYPNPVKPDYYGYVTISGLADNALVKIVDTSGNLIKELGFAAVGETTWDVTNLNMKRVPTGVYYVLASGGPDQNTFSSVSKILVVN